MSALAHHIMLRLTDDRVIAPGPSARQRLARVVLEQSKDFGLIAFCGADTHLHVLAHCDRQSAGRLAWRIEVALGKHLSLDVGFAPAHVKSVVDQRHLANAFFYILGQQRHHDCYTDPYHDASILPDLLGLRVVGAYAAVNVRALLPRVNRQQLVSCLGIDAPDRPVTTFQPLAEATAAAAGLSDLKGRSLEVVAARRAAVHAVGRGLTAAQLGETLNICSRTVKRLRKQPSEPRLVRAIQLQLRLRQPTATEPPASQHAANGPM